MFGPLSSRRPAARPGWADETRSWVASVIRLLLPRVRLQVPRAWGTRRGRPGRAKKEGPSPPGKLQVLTLLRSFSFPPVPLCYYVSPAPPGRLGLFESGSFGNLYISIYVSRPLFGVAGGWMAWPVQCGPRVNIM